MERSTKLLLSGLSLLLVLCGGYAAVLAWFDGDRIRTVVSNRLAERYGVALRVDSLERSFSFWPRLQIHKVEVANAKRSDEVLIAIDSASLRVHPLSFLIGPVTLDDIVIDGIRISVPVNDKGALYWDPLVEAMSDWLHRFDWSLRNFSVRNLHTESRHVDRSNDLLASAKLIEGTMPRPEDLVIKATGVDANLETTLPLRLHGTAKLEQLSLQRQRGDLPVTLVASGYIGDKILKINASGGNLLAGDPMERDPLRATIEVGASVAELHGTMSRDDPMHLALAVVFDKPGKDEEPDLHVEIGVSDPGISWRLTGIQAQQGDRTLTGAIEINNERGRRYFGGSLTVSNLQYPEDEKAGKQDDDNSQEKGIGDVLPKGDLYSHLLEFTKEFDADFTLNAEGSRLLGVPFKQVTLRTVLDRGALLASIEDSRIHDTSVKGTFRVTPTEGGANIDLEAALRDVQISRIVAGVEKLDGVTGLFDGEITLHASGSDSAAVLGSTSGRMTAYLSGGTMPDKTATLIAGDILTAVFANFDDNDKTAIRCAIADFAVENGVARSRRVMMDTGEFLMFGSGDINLKRGYLNLQLVPRARDFSLVSMQVPLHINGPLNKPQLKPDMGEGVASLLTPIELGDKEEVDCTPPDFAATASEHTG